MSDSCIFCKMISGEIKSEKFHEDDEFICIRDIHPQAKTHLLVIPREHIASLDDVFPHTGRVRTELAGRLMEAGVRIARKAGLLPGGFRCVINTHRDGGQTVDHLHMHVLGGQALRGDFGG